MAAAFLFDLDGTLADTAPDLAAAINRLREEEGLAPLPLETLRPHTSSGARGMLRAAFGLQPDDAAYPHWVERFLAHYESALCVHTRLFEGMHDVIDRLEADGIPWGIVTNKKLRYARPLIEQLGLATRTCCLVGGDSAPRPKPAPDPLLLACEQADLDPARSWYVGDDLRDIQAARAAGMPCVAVAWGYLGEDLPIEDWQADHTLARPAELLALPRL